MEKDQSERYLRAKHRVGQLRAFYTSLAAYVVINIALFLINVFTRGDGDGWWFYWVTIFWGIGLLFQAYGTFVKHGVLGRDWEERKIREHMERDEQ